MRFISIAVLAAALLVPLTTARAATSPQIGTQEEAVQAAAPQESEASAAPQDQDSALNIIVIQSGDEQFIPNPFKNPSPRMISDAWAQRT